MLGLLALVSTAAAWGADPVPTPIGVTREYRLAPAGPEVRNARPVGDLVCARTSPTRFRVHLELFAKKLVLLLPAGIGVAPPHEREGAYVTSGRCVYALRTREPTGVIEVATQRAVTVGDLFRVWGQRLGTRRLAGFRSNRPVLAFVNGRRVPGDPRAIPLRRHDEIVLEIGGYVVPHTSYLFPKIAQ